MYALRQWSVRHARGMNTFYRGFEALLVALHPLWKLIGYERRNGPCGGVRANGHCEVRPEMKCVWVQAVAGAARIPGGRQALQSVQVAVDRRLEGKSSWLRVVRQRVGETP